MQHASRADRPPVAQGRTQGDATPASHSTTCAEPGPLWSALAAGSSLAPATADAAQSDGASVDSDAARGITGRGQPLPHLDRLQRAFGAHDLSGVRAHEGGAASGAADKLGARAYTMGDDVVLGAGGANLRTVAHEAAHVVQQRAGVVPPGGVGRPGDQYERQADQVADTVTRGGSAAGLLDRLAAPRGGDPARGGINGRVIQFELLEADESPASVVIIRRVAEGDNVAAMRALSRAIKQVAFRRRTATRLDHVVCVGGGDSFDLRLTPQDSDAMRALLDERLAELRRDARASAERAAEAPPGQAVTGAFATAFNAHFASILQALRDADPNSAGLDPAQPFTEEELRVMFSPRQRALLTRFIQGGIIPDRLFSGDDVGGANAHQRLVLSGRILATGTYSPGSFSQRLHARMCGHWAQLVHHYAGVSASGGRGIYGQFTHSGQLVLGAGRDTAIHVGERRTLPPDEQVGNRRFRRESLPISEFDSIQPGDWLYIHTGVNTAGGDHSVIFSHWIDSEIQEEGGVRYRRAVTFDQTRPERGG